MTIQFLYFDLGQVLVQFSIEKMLRQMSEVSGVPPETIKEVIFHMPGQTGLQNDFETGKIDAQGFYDGFCKATGTRPDRKALEKASTEIFWVHSGTMPIVARLQEAGYRLGVLSNTCATHWEYCYKKYSLVAECFEIYALSYKIGATKPSAAIFRAAAEMTGCRPEEIFFCDDLPMHVAGAKEAGFDAVQFTTPAALHEELLKRGIRMNY